MEEVIIVSNPGSASRKYAVFGDGEILASLHFEHSNGAIMCGLSHDGIIGTIEINITKLSEAATQIKQILENESILSENVKVRAIGLRIVSPGSYFLSDRLIDDELTENLNKIKPRAPLHISSVLSELEALRNEFPDVPIAGISDSAFHATKPDFAWNYGISLHDADNLDIKRFGYHGLSVSSIVHQLTAEHKLPPKLIVCHIGGGVSVSALKHGKSIDNTMGYSPLEGAIMATRSGSIDFTAVRALRDSLGLDDEGIEVYLNHHSGLLGLGGASSVLDLLKARESGDEIASLALKTYTYNLTKLVGQMAASLNGVDMLVFTGTIGERSSSIRNSIVENLGYLDLQLNQQENENCTLPQELTRINTLVRSKPIYVIPSNENFEIAKNTQALI